MPRQILKPLHLAAGSDEENPSTMLIGIRKNTATASNGNLMVKLDLTKTASLSSEDLEILDGKYIHKNTWKEIHKVDELEITEKAIHCHVNGVKKTFYYEKEQSELWDNDVAQKTKEGGDANHRMICLSASQIQTIHSIFQQDSLHFSFSPKKGGVVIWPTNDSGMFAILAPEETMEMNRYIFLD